MGNHAPRSMKYALWGLISGTLSILAIPEVTKITGHPLLIGSFGASAVLLFGANDSPLASRETWSGGICCRRRWRSSWCRCSARDRRKWPGRCACRSFSCMSPTLFTLPGGATALIGVQGHAALSFLLVPVLAGVLILLLVAQFTNNIVHQRRYPKHWF